MSKSEKDGSESGNGNGAVIVKAPDGIPVAIPTDPEKQKEMAKRGHQVKGALVEMEQEHKKQIHREFKQWKRMLVNMIRTGARIVTGAGGKYQFLLPPALVKLVWSTTIQERIKHQQARGLEGDEAVKAAQEGLRNEVDEAQQAQQQIHVVYLSQLMVAWDILQGLAENDEANPVSFADLGKALNKAGVRVLDDRNRVPHVMEAHRKNTEQQAEEERIRREVKASRPTPLREMTPEEVEEEASAAASLAEMRAELVKDDLNN